MKKKFILEKKIIFKKRYPEKMYRLPERNIKKKNRHIPIREKSAFQKIVFLKWVIKEMRKSISTTKRSIPNLTISVVA
jgi:hypothetical protein